MADSLEGYTPEEIAQMASTYKAILDNPETRSLGLRATQHLNPKAVIPELQLENRVGAALQKERERTDKLEQEVRERDARDRVMAERTSLREAGHSKADVDAIEALMIEEKKNGNHLTYELAARYYKGQQQMAAPTPHNVGPALTYSMPTDALASLKGGKAGLSKFARESAAQALDDLRSGRIKLQ